MTTGAAIFLMGPPGSGKGTQALAVENAFGFERFETGGALRRLALEDSPLGSRVKALIDAGRLAAPPLVSEIVVREAERMLGSGQSVVFDGSPRTLFEAERLLTALGTDRVGRLLVIILEVPKPETVKRIAARWICAGCTRPTAQVPETLVACRACGGRLVRRPDDTESVAERRWEEYTFRTLPVIAFFERQGLVVRVDGHRPIPAVTDAVASIVRQRFGP